MSSSNGTEVDPGGKNYDDAGSLSHIIYMYIFCFGIIAALLVVIMVIRCLVKLKKKAKAQFTKIECNRRTSSVTSQEAKQAKESVEIEVLDNAPLVT